MFVFNFFLWTLVDNCKKRFKLLMRFCCFSGVLLIDDRMLLMKIFKKESILIHLPGLGFFLFIEGIIKGVVFGLNVVLNPDVVPVFFTD
jgi:hypothetical protein